MTSYPKVVSTFYFTPPLQEKLREAAETDVLCLDKDNEAFLPTLRQAEILCAGTVPTNWRELAPHLRWLQAPSAGVDQLHTSTILDAESGVIVTTASGIHVTTISEYVFGSMLMFNRSWPAMVEYQFRHEWAHDTHTYHLRERELAGRTLGIVGLGNIGRRIAQVARAFGMQVLATRRSAQGNEQVPGVDRVYPMQQLHEMLHLCDYVVLAMPLSADTEKMIGAPELRAMRPDAYLVNIARGRVVDEAALIQALREGWIAGAGLDVTAQEPLPPESPLYDLPNVILTPHVSGASEHYEARLADLFADNLRRYRTGQPLLNRYDPDRGY